MKTRLLPILISFASMNLLPMGQQKCLAQEGDWKTVTNTGIIHRHENSFAEVNGKFILIGGRGNKEYNIYDPVSKVWTKGKGKLPKNQIHHFQAVPFEGKIYIVGAFNGGHPSETPEDSVQIYDPVTDAFKASHEIPKDRRRGAAGAVVYNNKIYVIGGAVNGHVGGNVAWLDEYDPKSGAWKTLPDAPTARDHFQAAVYGDKLYVVGGRRSKGTLNGTSFTNQDEYFAITDVFDFKTGQWDKSYPAYVKPRAGTASVVLNNHLLLIGGESNTQQIAHNETEALDLANKTWKNLAPLDTGRHATHALVYNNKVYIASGSKSKGGSGSSELYSMEEFSFSTAQADELMMPSQLDFGRVTKDEDKSIWLKIKNVSVNKPITISAITLKNNTGNEFAILNPPALPMNLAANQVLEIQVQLSPSTAGMKTSQLEITHTGTNGPSLVELRGDGVLEVTGTDRPSIFRTVLIYPNPAKNMITVSDIPEELNWEIMNNLGVTMLSGETAMTNEALIDISRLLPGVYILTLNSQRENARQSFVIKKD